MSSENALRLAAALITLLAALVRNEKRPRRGGRRSTDE